MREHPGYELDEHVGAPIQHQAGLLEVRSTAFAQSFASLDRGRLLTIMTGIDAVSGAASQLAKDFAPRQLGQHEVENYKIWLVHARQPQALFPVSRSDPVIARAGKRPFIRNA